MKNMKNYRCCLSALILCLVMTTVISSAQLEVETSFLPSGMEMVAYAAQLEATGAPPYTWSAVPQVVAWGRNWGGQANVPPDLADAVAIAAGASHSLALKSDGSVVAWGANSFGQTDVPSDLADVVAIAGGGGHSLALRHPSTMLPAGLSLSTDGVISGITALAGTNSVTFIVRDSVGGKWQKELEIVIEPNSNTRPVIDATDPAQGVVSMDENNDRVFSVTAHDPEGQPLTYAWTWNGVPVGANADSYTHHAPWGSVGTHVLRCYVSDDLWTNIVYAQWRVMVQKTPRDITTIELPNGMEGVAYAAQLEATGEPPYSWSIAPQVVAWGANSSGQCDVPSGLADVAAIAAGDRHSLALKSDGSVIAWGRNQDGQTNVPPDLADVVAIAAGSSHSLALKSDGSVVAWGYNWYGQTDVPSDLEDVAAIARGGNHSLALRHPSTTLPAGLSLSADGVISGVPTLAGTNSVTFIVQDSVGGKGQKVMEIVIEPNLNMRPVIDATDPAQGEVRMDENSIRVFSLTAHDPEGQPLTYAWTWNGVPVGANAGSYTHHAPWGSVGTHVLRCYVSDDLWTNIVYAQWWVTVQEAPRDITTLELPTGMEMVAYAAQLEATGAPPFSWSIARQVVAWGANSYGQSDVPPGLADVMAIAAGGNHNLALKSDGSVVAWGGNWYGQTDVPPGLAGVVAIAAGWDHSLALKSDGSVVAWGYHWYGQADVPPDLANVVSIAAGEWHSLAMKSDGSVVGWGANSYDQTDVPSGLMNAVAIAAGSEHSLALRDVLPKGLSLSSNGVVSGVPTLAGTYSVTFMVQDSVGAQAQKELAIVIAPNPNKRPVIDSTDPVQGVVSMAENSNRVFSVTAHDPEGEPLTYHWTLNGEPVGDGTANYTHTTEWGYAGFYDLRCYVSDDLWDQIVHAQWYISVEMMDSNGDGILDWWWEQHGFDHENPPDAESKADISGMTYREKFYAGLIPGDPNSRFELGGVEVAGDPETGMTITFVFDTVPGRRYIVQARASLTDGAWTNISDVITATADRTVYTAQTPGALVIQFYRLVVLYP